MLSEREVIVIFIVQNLRELQVPPTFPLDVVVVSRLDGLSLAHPRDLGHGVAREGDLYHHVLALVEVCGHAEAWWHVQFWCGC